MKPRPEDREDAGPPAEPLDGRRQFASDNYAGICPEAWDAMAVANVGHAPSYGEDEWTREPSNRTEPSSDGRRR